MHVNPLIHFANSLNLKTSRGLRASAICFYVANFLLSLWWVWPFVDNEHECMATLLSYTWGRCSPYQRIHVALDFVHVQHEVAAQIDT